MWFNEAELFHCDAPAITGGEDMMVWTMKGAGVPESRTAKYIVTDLQMPAFQQSIDAEYSTFAKRVLWMDDQVVEGAFHMNVAWYLSVPNRSEGRPHAHDTDEIIGFFGSDPARPYDLGGELEIWLDGEQHVIDRSCMIFVPAGMQHCPLTLRRVDRPIFHFTTVTGHQYDQTADE